MIPGIILAGGNSTRIGKTKQNKVVLSFLGEPMIVKAYKSIVDLCSPVYIVVGAYQDSVKTVLKDYPVQFVEQKQRLGTADAVKTVLPYLSKIKPKCIIIGYGDNMMLNNQQMISDLISKYHKQNAVITFVSTVSKNPINLGRVLYNSSKQVVGIVEEKDATFKQKNIKVINTGIYCINYSFLVNNIAKINKSPVSGEYYLTDLIEIATKQKLPVYDLCVGYNQVGGGVNTIEQLKDLEKIKN